jgi:predicted MFS family arabinose efflux permease
VIRPVVKKLGDLNTLYAGILALGLGLLFFPIIASVTNGNNTLGYILIMGNAYLMNLGISLSSPTFKSLLTNSVDEKRQGIITGLDEALLALGQGITPIIAGLSYSLFGTSTFVLFAVLLALPHLIIWLKTGHAKVQTQS